jgi:hypothetical protein
MRRIMPMLLVAALAVAALAPTASATSDRNYRTHLSGAEAGVETLAQGQAILQFSRDGASMHYKLILANIDDVVGAHIHLAPAGSNGPIVVNLFGAPFVPDPGVDVNGVLAEGTITAADLAGPLAGMSLDDLRQAIFDGNTYVNVHTVANRGGEVRGQL